MLGRVWRRVRRWFARRWAWLAAAFVFVLALVSVRHRRQRERQRDAERRAMAMREAERAQTERQLASAMRTALRQRAEAAAIRAAEHQGRADQAAEQAQWAAKRVEAMSDGEVVARYREISRMRRRPRVLPLVVFAALSFSAQRVEASDVSLANDPIEMPHPHTKRPGLWLDMEIARDLLADVEQLEDMRREVAELRASLEHRRGEARALEDAVVLAEASARASAGDAVRAMAVAERERVRARVWWRRPSLWFGVGTVVGAGCVAALVMGVQ